MVSASRLLLLDSDMFILHAGAGLLPALARAAGSELRHVRRLQPLPHMLRRMTEESGYPAGIREKAIAWCSEITSIEEAPSAAVLDQFLQIPELHPGEAVLFSVAAEMEHSLVATGDKRACRALAALATSRLTALMKHKVVCLASALALLIRQLGFRALVEGLSLVRECNQTLRVLLPQGELTPESHFKEGLRSYLTHLQSETGDLLLPTAFD